MIDREKLEKIADNWGWTLEELENFLEDGGSSNEIMNISAMQTAHAIIAALAKGE